MVLHSLRTIARDNFNTILQDEEVSGHCWCLSDTIVLEVPIFLDNSDNHSRHLLNLCNITNRMDFTTEERTEIEKRRLVNDKLSLAYLERIYNSKTGTTKRDCFCSSVRRKVWHNMFFEWYDANK